MVFDILRFFFRNQFVYLYLRFQKSLHLITVTIYVVLCLLHGCSSYPSGAPLEACQEMRPYHPPTTTSGTPPFAINLTQTGYRPGSEISGNLLILISNISNLSVEKKIAVFHFLFKRMERHYITLI